MFITRRILNPIRSIGFDWFIIALLLMIFSAWLYPGPGMASGVFSLKSLAGLGISVIFFLYGLRLSLRQLLNCLANWRLHTIIQSVTFIAFPLIALSFNGLFPEGQFHLLWLGIFFLASLPSTVSSAVVMVSIAGGNIPAAVFNASFSSIAGILITPLWMGLVIAGSTADFDMNPVLLKLSYQVLLPLFMGILLNRWFGLWAVNTRKYTTYFDQAVVLAIIYTSFSNSFSSGLFRGFGAEVIAVLIFTLVLLFTTINLFLYLLVKKAGLSKADLVTALFCGSTKSLMHGSVMARVMFGSAGLGGIILLPVLIYHALQLTATGIMARWFSVKSDQPEIK